VLATFAEAIHCIGYYLQTYPKSTEDKGKGLPVTQKIYSKCSSLYKHHTLFITMAILYALKSEYVKPPNLIFVFLRALTALCSLLYRIIFLDHFINCDKKILPDIFLGFALDL
jgi:hypothetical protein